MIALTKRLWSQGSYIRGMMRFYEGSEACVRVVSRKSEILRMHVSSKVGVCDATLTVHLVYGWGEEGSGCEGYGEGSGFKA